MTELTRNDFVPGIDDLILQLDSIWRIRLCLEPSSAEDEWMLERHRERVEELQETILDEWPLLMRLWNETLDYEPPKEPGEEQALQNAKESVDLDDSSSEEQGNGPGETPEKDLPPPPIRANYSPPSEAREWTGDAMPTCFSLSAWGLHSDDWSRHYDTLRAALQRMRLRALDLPPEKWIDEVGGGELPVLASVHVTDLSPLMLAVVQRLRKTPGLTGQQLCVALEKRPPRGLNDQLRKLRALKLVYNRQGHRLRYVPKGLETE